jgi:hypothetical protein
MKVDREVLPGLSASLIVLLAAITVMLWVVVSAIRTEPLPPPAAPYVWSDLAAAPDSVAVDIDRVLEADPFRAGALETSTRKGEPDPNAIPSAPCELAGTVVGLDGQSFAMCASGGISRTLRIGESIGGWTLLAIEQGRARFRDARGERIELSVTKAREDRQ